LTHPPLKIVLVLSKLLILSTVITLMPIFDIFITAKIANGRSRRTVADYKRVLTRFFKHVGRAPTWDRHTIRKYVAGLYDLPWAPATVALHVRYLRAFWAWLYREGYIGEDLSRYVSAPRHSMRDEELLTVDEFMRLVLACSGDRFALRDRAIILLFTDTGLRRGEFSQLRRDNVKIDQERGWILLPGETTKSGNDRFVFMGEATTQALCAYLETREDDNAALFMGERGPLGGDGLYSLLRRRAELAGLDKRRVHPHLLRKVFATWWIENGGDEQRLMKIGGWSGPEMLRIYVRLGSRQKLQEAHEQFGPVDRLFDDTP